MKFATFLVALAALASPLAVGKTLRAAPSTEAETSSSDALALHPSSKQVENLGAVEPPMANDAPSGDDPNRGMKSNESVGSSARDSLNATYVLAKAEKAEQRILMADANTIAQETIKHFLGMVPGAGPYLSLAAGLFWPQKTEKSTWDKISDQVKNEIAKAVAENDKLRFDNRMRDVKKGMENLHSSLEDYTADRTNAQELSQVVERARDLKTYKLKLYIPEDKEHQVYNHKELVINYRLMPYAVTFALLHVGILKEQYLYRPGNPNLKRRWLRDLEKNVQEYEDYFSWIEKRWKQWRETRYQDWYETKCEWFRHNEDNWKPPRDRPKILSYYSVTGFIKDIETGKKIYQDRRFKNFFTFSREINQKPYQPPHHPSPKGRFRFHGRFTTSGLCPSSKKWVRLEFGKDYGYKIGCGKKTYKKNGCGHGEGWKIPPTRSRKRPKFSLDRQNHAKFLRNLIHIMAITKNGWMMDLRNLMHDFLKPTRHLRKNFLALPRQQDLCSYDELVCPKNVDCKEERDKMCPGQCQSNDDCTPDKYCVLNRNGKAGTYFYCKKKCQNGCASDQYCALNQKAGTYHCKKKIPVGSRCFRDWECVSKKCISDQGKHKICAKNPAGSRCSHNGECASGLCSISSFTSFTAEHKELVCYAQCKGNDDCGPGTFCLPIQDLCYPLLPRGNRCVEDDQCASGSCSKKGAWSCL